MRTEGSWRAQAKVSDTGQEKPSALCVPDSADPVSRWLTAPLGSAPDPSTTESFAYVAGGGRPPRTDSHAAASGIRLVATRSSRRAMLRMLLLERDRCIITVTLGTSATHGTCRRMLDTRPSPPSWRAEFSASGEHWPSRPRNLPKKPRIPATSDLNWARVRAFMCTTVSELRFGDRTWGRRTSARKSPD